MKTKLTTFFHRIKGTALTFVLSRPDVSRLRSCWNSLYDLYMLVSFLVNLQTFFVPLIYGELKSTERVIWHINATGTSKYSILSLQSCDHWYKQFIYSFIYFSMCTCSLFHYVKIFRSFRSFGSQFSVLEDTFRKKWLAGPPPQVVLSL